MDCNASSGRGSLSSASRLHWRRKPRVPRYQWLCTIVFQERVPHHGPRSQPVCRADYLRLLESSSILAPKSLTSTDIMSAMTCNTAGETRSGLLEIWMANFAMQSAPPARYACSLACTKGCAPSIELGLTMSPLNSHPIQKEAPIFRINDAGSKDRVKDITV